MEGQTEAKSEIIIWILLQKWLPIELVVFNINTNFWRQVIFQLWVDNNFLTNLPHTVWKCLSVTQKISL